MNRSESGQALVEWALLLPLYTMLLAAIVVFGQWFVIRHQLLGAVREEAFLYSSGRMTAEETRALAQRNLANGFPALMVPAQGIYVGRHDGFQARLFRLDEVRIVYHPTSLMRTFRFHDMEEKCVIKHAPSYWQTEIPGVNLGPPVPW